MSRRRIFSVVTPLGYRVSLTRDRWRLITRYKHPALAGKELFVRACLTDPILVRKSEKDSDTHLYYHSTSQGFVCVVASPDRQSSDWFVTTAYFTRKIKKGSELWKK